MATRAPPGAAVTGVAYGLAAGLVWGLGPIYWKAIQTVPAVEIVAQRVVWSVLFLALLMALLRQLPALRQAVRVRRNIVALFATAVLISVNWSIYIWAVNAGFVLDVSFGYFISPLVGVLLGTTILRERLRRWQAVAVALAAIGVANQVVSLGTIPWIGLVLAFTFGFYGLIRKVVPAGPLVGLGIETTLILPFALGYIVWLSADGQAVSWSLDAGGMALVVGAGVVTALPLLWFAQAARRVRLSTIGLILYVAPSCQFGLAVFLYGEAFTVAHLVTFAFIWAGLLVYSVDSTRAHRRDHALGSI